MPRAVSSMVTSFIFNDPTTMTKTKFGIRLTIAVLLFCTGDAVKQAYSEEEPKTGASLHSALTVQTVQPIAREIPAILSSYGSIAAWQETVIGAEVNGLRLSEVKAQIGDRVKKGQTLALFDNRGILADLAQSRAAVAEAEANLAEARLKSRHAQQVASSGALSEMQVIEYVTGEKTAAAKLQSMQAQLEKTLLQEHYTKVVAGDDGIISARNAVLGSVVSQGQELFRLIRQNRLEWQAEIATEELARLAPGIAVTVTVPGFPKVHGNIRALAPTVDAKNRKAVVFVDLPDASPRGLRPGMFARGEFQLGTHEGITLPQESLCLRDGFNYAFKLERQTGGTAQVTRVKLTPGLHAGDWVEILAGIAPDERFVASGTCFLNDGDTVTVAQK